MLRRTLAVLTPALFALPLLLTPASQVHADADMDGSVYSGLECKYLDSYAMEGQMMDGGDVVYHSRLGIGNNAPRSRDEATPMATDGTGDTRQYRMKVGCPLPSFEEMEGGTVIVGVVDGTVFDDVTCYVKSCVVGLGILSGGEGGCIGEDKMVSTRANLGGFYPGNPSPYTQGDNYITQNISWLKIEVGSLGNEDGGARNEVAEADGTLGKAYSHLICTLPERDDQSVAAPVLRGDDGMPLAGEEQGISYIQTYYVK